jgi:peptidoglycan/xylan/chitin deacetylase (PgdA/CDA1 family)
MRSSVVLCYHGVSSSWPSSLAITPDRFREQIEFLLGRGCRPVLFGDLVEHSGANGSGRHEGAFAVTFDDGYRSVLEQAFPVLAELGVPATVFVPTDLVERPGPMCWDGIEQWLGTPHEYELEGLDWGELRELGANGWEIGSHACTHPRLTELDSDSLQAELRESRRRLERELSAECTSRACPYGDQDERVRAAARAAGYRAAGSMCPGKPDPMCWPRVGIYPNDGPLRFRLKASPAVSEFRATGLGRLIERARVSLLPAEVAVIEDALSVGLW